MVARTVSFLSVRCWSALKRNGEILVNVTIVVLKKSLYLQNDNSKEEDKIVTGHLYHLGNSEGKIDIWNFQTMQKMKNARSCSDTDSMLHIQPIHSIFQSLPAFTQSLCNNILKATAS